MTLTNTTVKARYAGDDATVNFAIPFGIIESGSDETEVILRDESDSDNITETVQAEGVDYTLTGGTPPTTVTMTTAPTSDEVLIVRRMVDKTQESDYIETGEFPAKTHELGLDKLTALVQEDCEKLTRTPILSKGTPITSFDLPEPVAETYLRWNSSANAIEYITTTQLADLINGEFLTIANNLSDLASVSAALINLGIAPLSTLTSTAVTDGQSAADVSGTTFDGTTYSSAVLDYEVIRGTTVVANGRLSMQYRNGTWRVEDGGYEGDAHGVTWSVNQVSTSGTLRAALDVGAGNGTIKVKTHTFTA